MLRLRIVLLFVGTLVFLNLAEAAFAQYYPPSRYGYPPGSRPPCEEVMPGPLQGAARGAAGGAIIGAISGNGRGGSKIPRPISASP